MYLQLIQIGSAERFIFPKRYPSKVQVLSSDGPTIGSWTEVAVASTSTTIAFEQPIESRFMRIVMLSVHDGGAVDDTPIATAG